MAMKNLANCVKTAKQQNRQFGVFTGTNRNDGIKAQINQLHVTAQQSYPLAAVLPMPANIDPSETTRFSPQRNRDISANAILTHQSSSFTENPMDITVDNSAVDLHLNSYDCTGAVSLNSSMQSNVPSPFGGLHKFTHLNMPGGQWGQDSKFMSQNLQNSHYTNLRREARAGWSEYNDNATTLINKGTNQTMTRMHFNRQAILDCNQRFYNLHELTRSFSSNANDKKTKSPLEQEKQDQMSSDDDVKLSRKDQLKRTFKEYGATVIVFHVGISLASLGLSYLVVSRGIDVMPLLEAIGLGSSALSNKIAAGASTFVIAYAIHKVFAPVRISITLGATPFIVRYLRSKGILKVKKQ